MRAGAVQRSIIAYLTRCGADGGHIGATSKAPEFSGLDLKQVERAIEGLLRRRIVRREGIRLVLVGK